MVLVTAYLPSHDLPWMETLIGHVVAATLASSIATIALHLRSPKHAVARTFGLKATLLLMSLAAVAAALLRNIELHPFVAGCALIPIVVYPLTCYFAVRLKDHDRENQTFL